MIAFLCLPKVLFHIAPRNSKMDTAHPGCIQLILQATRPTPHVSLRAWCKLAMSASSVKTRRAPSRHCREAEGLWSYIRLRPCTTTSTLPSPPGTVKQCWARAGVRSLLFFLIGVANTEQRYHSTITLTLTLTQRYHSTLCPYLHGPFVWNITTEAVPVLRCIPFKNSSTGDHSK